MSGEQFEAQLGSFLRQVEAFRAIEGLVESTTQFPNIPEPFKPQGVLRGWYQQCSSQFDQIMETIHKSLYENFFESSIDTQAAVRAFAQLFQTLGVTPATRFVFASTNYDIIATRVLSELGFKPDWGPLPPVNPSAESDLHVDNLLGGMGRYTPLLHLHGKAGWYLRPDGRAAEINNTKFAKEFGTPLVMLPDPNKDYGASATINALWDQFRTALKRAKRVLVLGHSLNDAFLVQALREDVEPLARIAVSIYLEGNRSPETTSGPVERIVASNLRGAAMIPVQFGSADIGQSDVEPWLEAVAKL
jgi:hypothetical protein